MDIRLFELQPNVYLLVRIDGVDALRVEASGTAYGDGYDADSVFDAMEAEGFAESVGPSEFTAGTGGDMVTGTTKANALANLADAGQMLADGLGDEAKVGVWVNLGSGAVQYTALASGAVGGLYEAVS